MIAAPAPAGVRLSVNVTNFSWPDGPGALRRHLSSLAQALDAAGVHTLWVSDHLWQADPFAKLEEPMLEAYTTLGFLAAATTRLRQGDESRLSLHELGLPAKKGQERFSPLLRDDEGVAQDASCRYQMSSRKLVSGSWMWMEVTVPHFGRTAERLRLTTGRVSRGLR